MKVFISGQKHFGAEVLRLCLKMRIEVAGVSCPHEDRYLKPLAELHGVPVILPGVLSKDTMPACDLGVTAHSFAYIDRGTRFIPR